MGAFSLERNYMSQKKIAAIFDIDGTVFRDSLLLQHLEKCVDYDVFPTKAREEIKIAKKQWKNRELDYDEYMLQAVEVYQKYLNGKHEEDIEFVARKVIEKQYQLLYTYTRNLIEWHREQGHILVFISGSPTFLVWKLAEKLGIDIAFASEYTVENGYFAQGVKPMWDSISKQKSLDKLEQHYNIDLSHSYAYGDTTGDYTMLAAVGNPTAINPNQKLYQKIMDTKLPCKIVVERKDVIYKIQ